MSFSEQLTNGKFEPLEWPKDWTLSHGTTTQLPLDWVGYDLRDNGAIVQLHCRSRADSDTALFDFTVDPDPEFGKIDEARSDALVGHNEVYLVLRVIVPGSPERSYAVVQGYVPVKPYSGDDYPVIITPIALSELRQAIDDFNNLDQTTLDNVQSGLPSIIQVAQNLGGVNALATVASGIQALSPLVNELSALGLINNEIQQLSAIDQELQALAGQSTLLTELGGYIENQSSLSSSFVNYRVFSQSGGNSVTVRFDSLTLAPILGVSSSEVTEYFGELSIDDTNYQTEAFVFSSVIEFNLGEWTDVYVYRLTNGSLKLGLAKQSEVVSHPNDATHFVKAGLIALDLDPLFPAQPFSIRFNTDFFDNQLLLATNAVIPSQNNVSSAIFKTITDARLPEGAQSANITVRIHTTPNLIGDYLQIFEFDGYTYRINERVVEGVSGSGNPDDVYFNITHPFNSVQTDPSFVMYFGGGQTLTVSMHVNSINLASPISSQDITSSQQLRDTLANSLLQGTHNNVAVTYDPQSGNINLSSPSAGATAFKDASFGDGSNGYTQLTGSVNGTNTAFTVSQGSYAPGTIRVTADSLNYLPLAGIVETDPANGIFTLDVAPTYNVIAEYT